MTKTVSKRMGSKHVMIPMSQSTRHAFQSPYVLAVSSYVEGSSFFMSKVPILLGNTGHFASLRGTGNSPTEVSSRPLQESLAAPRRQKQASGAFPRLAREDSGATGLGVEPKRPSLEAEASAWIGPPRMRMRTRMGSASVSNTGSGMSSGLVAWCAIPRLAIIYIVSCTMLFLALYCILCTGVLYDITYHRVLQLHVVLEQGCRLPASPSRDRVLILNAIALQLGEGRR